MLYLQKFDKILIETGQFSDIIRVTENGLVHGAGADSVSTNSTFKNISDRLYQLRVLALTSSFLVHRLACSLYFWPLHKWSFRVCFCTVYRSSANAMPSLQKPWFKEGTRCGVLGKFLKVFLLQICIGIEDFVSDWMGIAIKKNAWRLLVLKV